MEKVNQINNEGEIRNFVDEILKKDVEKTWYYFKEEVENFYLENKEDIFEVIDQYIASKKLTLNQLYCLVMVKTDDKLEQYESIYNNIKGANEKNAKILAFLIKLMPGFTKIDELENNLQYFEDCIKDYVKEFE